MPFISQMFHDPVIASWVQGAIYLLTLMVLSVQARILIRQTMREKRIHVRRIASLADAQV